MTNILILMEDEMAYLRQIPAHKCRCGKKATVELINRHNAPQGKYCDLCGRQALRKQKIIEDGG